MLFFAVRVYCCGMSGRMKTSLDRDVKIVKHLCDGLSEQGAAAEDPGGRRTASGLKQRMREKTVLWGES